MTALLKDLRFGLRLGRSFSQEEDTPGAEIPVTIISHPLWERLGARSEVLGSILRINQRRVLAMSGIVLGRSDTYW